MALAGQVTNPDRLEGRDVSFQSDGTAINSYLVGRASLAPIRASS